jgi:hypothetical protein
VQRSTLDSEPVERCIAEAMRHCQFPAVRGAGDIVVTYPFVLVPTGAEPPASDEEQALAALASSDPLDHRVGRIARWFRLPVQGGAAELAWAVEKRAAKLERLLLVARLLDLGQRRPDAIRVLSERARNDPDAIAAELRRMGEEEEAARVLAVRARTVSRALQDASPATTKAQ